MPVELEICEIDDYNKCLDYITSKQNHVTYKMLVRDCNVKPKIIRRALQNHKETMLCDPIEHGSYKFTNKNLYKKVNKETIKIMCETELVNMNKNKLFEASGKSIC